MKSWKKYRDFGNLLICGISQLAITGEYCEKPNRQMVQDKAIMPRPMPTWMRLHPTGLPKLVRPLEIRKRAF